MISVFMGPSIVIVPLAGLLADQYGRKLLLAPSILIFGIPGALIAFTTDYHAVLLLRLLQGIGWGGLTPLIVTSIGDFYEGSEETTAQGLRQTGTALVGGGISLLAGALVVMAWQFPFLLYLLTIPIAGVVYVFFDEPTDTDRNQSSTSSKRNFKLYSSNIVELIRQQRILFILIARTLPMVVWIGFATYNSIIVTRILGGTPVQAGIIYTVASLFMALAASQVGRFAGIIGNRYSLLIGANVSLGGGLVIFSFATDIPIAILGGMGVGVGMGITIPLYRTLITDFAPKSVRAGLVSLGSAGSRLMATVTPIATGLIIASATPIVGVETAIKLAGLGAGVIGGGAGLICVIVALLSPTVDIPSEKLTS